MVNLIQVVQYIGGESIWINPETIDAIEVLKEAYMVDLQISDRRIRAYFSNDSDRQQLLAQIYTTGKFTCNHRVGLGVPFCVEAWLVNRDRLNYMSHVPASKMLNRETITIWLHFNVSTINLTLRKSEATEFIAKLIG